MVKVGEEKFYWKQHSEYPRKRGMLYKFHRVNEHLDELIVESKLFFPHQLDLNDVADCMYLMGPEMWADYEQHLFALVRKDVRFQPIDDIGLRHSIKETLREPEMIAQFYAHMFRNNGLNVCSFSETMNNEHMWSFYGDGHKGICLGFDFSFDISLQNEALPVIYRDGPPVLHSKEDYKMVPYIKRVRYHEEHEWRMTAKGHGKVKYSFNKLCLKSVVFGAQVTSKEYKRIIKLINDAGYHNVEFLWQAIDIGGVPIRFLELIPRPEANPIPKIIL